MEIIGALTFVVLIIFGASQNWKLSIKTILVIVLIEGALRRWAFPQVKDLIYFLKDFILIGAYIGFASRPRQLEDRYPFIKELSLVIAIVCFLQSFNPSLGSPIIGLLGIRAYLLYIPLIWIIPHLFDSESELYDFLRNYLLLLIPICILGIVQFFSPIDSPLNIYVSGSEAEIATAGEFVRITGTFSYLQGLKVYLAVCFSLLIVLLSQTDSFKWKTIYIFELTLVVANCFMSGARAIILYILLFTISYFVCLFFNSYKTALNFVSRLFLPVALVTLMAIVFFQPAIQSYNNRADTASDSVVDRAFGYFTDVFAKDRFDGYGTGATQGGAASLRQILELPAGESLPPSEEEPGRVMIEIGLLGFILWYGLRLVILISLYSVFLNLKNPFYKKLALAIFIFQLIHVGRQLVTDPTMLPYFWFFSGFIYLLPNLESREMQKLEIG
ncbi:hypothetical protein [Pseudanabaena sp. BC1403]|uniref:hypothetical protein n=1 Tax=Pseudanabaena sp. BC1403 TaxID=2043171 RepID=UPI000CD8EF1C|nr:hypothetical protein [Pseudanabaena sp. BC1403]